MEKQSSPHADDYLTIDPEFWRTIELETTTESGGTVSMTLLRPEAWVPFNGIEIGSELPMYLGEDVGVLPVTVVAIGPAPADIEPGSPTRGLVISTYQRTDRAVLDLFLDTDPTPLTITAEHPVWSVDRDGWVYAGDLRPGECVETLDGVAYVLASLPAGERTVYDIEVLGDHTFYAGEQGVWVHNCGGATRGLWRITKEGNSKTVRRGGQTYHQHKSTGMWWSKDTAGHGGSVWKVFKEGPKGLKWHKDADKYGTYITGKYKGPVGLLIPWKELK